MENQHRYIDGYRELSPEEIALMNLVKAKMNEIGNLIEDMVKDNSETLDMRWVNIANTHLQQGGMALVRAIAQPTTY